MKKLHYIMVNDGGNKIMADGVSYMTPEDADHMMGVYMEQEPDTLFYLGWNFADDKGRKAISKLREKGLYYGNKKASPGYSAP